MHLNIDFIYPIGSIYMAVNSTNPHYLFGGTWAQIQDRFLLGAGATYTNGVTGGEATHQLTVAEMPSHSHMPSSDAISVGRYFVTKTWNNGGVDPEVAGVGSWGGNRTQHTATSGGDQPHNNMPPYLVVYIWKRIA